MRRQAIPLRRLLVRWILIGLLLTSGIGIVRMLSIARSTALDFLRPEREVLTETPADYGLEYEEVALTTEDGLTLRGWFLPGTNGAAIILQHGYGASRQGMLPEAAMLHKHGYSVLLFDWRGHGESEGDMVTFGVHEIRDVQAAVDWLSSRPEVDAERIGAAGESMGAAALLYAAARIPELKAVVAESPFPSLADMVDIGIRQRTDLPTFPFAPLIVWFAEQEAGLPITSVDATKDIELISPRPVFLMHGGRDEEVPPESGEILFQAAHEPKVYWYDPEVTHADFAEMRPEEFEHRVVAFFDAALCVGSEGRRPFISSLLGMHNVSQGFDVNLAAFGGLWS